MIDVLRSFDDRIDPAHTAILVIDLQNDFCAEGGYIHRTRNADMSGNPALAQRISALTDGARAAGVTVVWVQANYEPQFLTGPALLKREQRDPSAVCCTGGSWGWQFYGAAPREEDLVIEKHVFSAFSGTDLDRILRARGIKTLVLTGVATNTCVESTLREGFFLGYYIVLAEDCCGSSLPHLHRATLDNVRANFGEVVAAGDLLKSWPPSAAGQ